MTQHLGVLITHGIGSQERGFSEELVEGLSDELGGDASRIAWKELYWADYLEDREKELWDTMAQAKDPNGNELELDWRRLRRFVVHNLADAIAYHRDARPASAAAYNRVHDRASSTLAELDAELREGAPVVVVAHSLGAVMLSDYIWDRQHLSSAGPNRTPIPNLTAMITFGATLPLFSLAYDVAKPINLPGEGVAGGPLEPLAKWLNYFDCDDVLGWPIRALYERHLDELDELQRKTVSKIEDREIDVGSRVMNWTPAAHNSYWTDEDFQRPVARYLAELLAAVDG